MGVREGREGARTDGPDVEGEVVGGVVVEAVAAALRLRGFGGIHIHADLGKDTCFVANHGGSFLSEAGRKTDNYVVDQRHERNRIERE